MSYAVTLLDFGLRGPDHRVLRARPARASPGRGRGARASSPAGRWAAAFTWMRPDDLVFNYWVNNYLMGDKPPAFDILAWNADGTNLPGALHGQFLDIFRDNLLTRPGRLTRARHPAAARPAITVPTFVTGAVTDHLTPWKGCYRTTQLLGGPVDLRAQLLRAHRQPGQPAGQPQGALLDRRRTRRPTPSSGWPAPRSSRAAGGRRGPSGPRPGPATGGPGLATWAASDTRSCHPRPGSTCATWSPTR